jgi:hypothetical protein
MENVDCAHQGVGEMENVDCAHQGVGEMENVAVDQVRLGIQQHP